MRFAVTVFLASLAVGFAVPAAAQQKAFTLSSPDIRNNTFGMMQVYNSFGCSGQNVSPGLAWKSAPKDARSFVVTLYDPDAPTGSGFWHWVVINIPPSATSIPTGASGTPKMPAGAVEMRTDFGTTGYGGPCPPQGDKPHRYIFTIFALRVDTLDVDPQATAAMVGFATRANAIATTTFTVTYGR
jgi:Raf kinase inhibitor-like YbhB/YbcL family protein